MRTKQHSPQPARGAVPLARALALALAAGGALAAQDADTAPQLLRSDSRFPYVHRITLYDRDGAAIDPADPDAPPYSPIMTCGKCHEVGLVRHGWHFNAAERGPGDAPAVDAGRPGEPWFLVDAASGTVLPISARGWPGTFTPADAGLSEWEFVQRFGRHMPGGGMADPEPRSSAASAEAQRWAISGTMQIDCMVCHSADASHDPAEIERQIGKHNLAWIPTAALGLGVIRGEARSLPDDFDPLAPPNPDRPDEQPPRVAYDRSRFDGDDRVLFNVTRRIPAERCYFCHSVREVGSPGPAAWHTDGDVHIAAGMRCVDCHRNGIDHMIARGYEGEAAARGDPAYAALTCRGCHLGTRPLFDGRDATAGRLGAPHPEHRGLPPVHLEKLTCTACHSGPWPEGAVRRFQTAMSHGLGVPTRERGPHDAPTILGPVFARPPLKLDPYAKIGPYRMVWPAYWGMMRGERVAPLSLDVVRRASAKLSARTKLRDGPPARLTDEDIAMMLGQLRAAARGEAEAATPVYVRDGWVHRLDGAGRLDAVARPDVARPYLWPIAHDVRPASQSLGVRGCTDCHADGAPIYDGRLSAADEQAGQAGPDADAARGRPLRTMHELRDEDLRLVRSWARLFAWRDAFKAFGFTGAAILAVVLLRSAFGGARWPTGQRDRRGA